MLRKNLNYNTERYLKFLHVMQIKIQPKVFAKFLAILYRQRMVFSEVPLYRCVVGGFAKFYE